MDKEIPKGKGRLISIKGNVRVRETEGRFDGALARVVVGRFELEVEEKSRKSEKKNEKGLNCLLFSEAGRCYLYCAGVDMKTSTLRD